MRQMTMHLLIGEMRTNPVVSPENLRPVLQQLIVPSSPLLPAALTPRGKVTAL
jgi:hypothetical protein